jgi:S-DNA-T family DNA segregation ATPase FtsK/SpoIIIE
VSEQPEERRAELDVRPDGDVEAAVFDGEIVDDEPRRPALTLVPTPPSAIRRWRNVHVISTVRTVATHDRTKQTARTTLATSLTVIQGFESWAKRAWDASTMGVYRRALTAAEMAGDREGLAAWAERYEKARTSRHQSLMDAPKLAWGLVKVLLGAMAGLFAVVLVIGILSQITGVGSFVGVIGGAIALVAWCLAVATAAWVPLLMALPALVILAAWREGKRRGKPPAWLVTAADADVDVTIDETTIAAALAALRIPQITVYFKAGSKLQFLTPARTDGRGTHAVIRLPSGVTAEKIARRRADLATGLYRLSKEVWPTTGAEAGILDLWVADKGALAEGAGPYPLLEGGAIDVFKGVPAGKTLRGTPMSAPLIGRNTITGGMPDQGKSSAARVLMIGAALDPTAELRIWVPDSNFDFEVFRPRCSRYVMGAEDERIAEILEDLRELHAEIQVRGEKLVQFEVASVTRELSNRNIGMHPIFALLEEAHVAIQHKEFGAEISQLLIDIVKLGRKRGIHLIVSTQAPTKDSMPRDVTRNCSNGIAFAVGDHVANDALLGQGAYRSGHRATELIPGTDRGTAVVKGFSGQRSEILQWYFLSVDEGNDQVTPLIDRSLEAIARRGKGLPGGERPAVSGAGQPPRNLLEDLDVVLGSERVKIADAPALLRDLAPDWTPYRVLNGEKLKTRLEDQYGVRVARTGNKNLLDPGDVRAALARLATADLDDE